MSNKIKIQILEYVLENLWDGVGDYRSMYICNLIENADIDTRVQDKFRDIIAERLDYAFCLKVWLHSNGVPLMDLTPKNVQAHRRAWVKLLIKEFGGK
jgi:hypothetical protein